MKESRVLLLIWQLTLGLFILEIGCGVFLGSLGLISDGVHTAANCLGVGTSLFAVRWAKRLTTKGYSYDLSVRAEVLAAFTNSVILLLLSAFLAFEALHQLVEAAHHSDHSDHVAFVGIAGITVNIVGLRLIVPHIGGWAALSRRLFSNSTMGDDAQGPRLLNLEAVALHCVFDIVSSLGVIASTMLSNAGFPAADSLIAVLIAGLTVKGANPMFRRTSRILAQASTSSAKTDSLLRELASVDGVLEFYQVHFWSLAPSKEVGSIVMRVRADADEERILTAAHRIFGQYLWSLTVQIEREKPLKPLLRPVPEATPMHQQHTMTTMRRDVHSHGLLSQQTTAGHHYHAPPQQPHSVSQNQGVVGLREAAHIL